MRLRITSQQDFERGLPVRFRSVIDALGAVVTANGDRLVIYNGFTSIATLDRDEANNFSDENETALRAAFDSPTE